MRAKFVDSAQNPAIKWIRRVCSDPKREGLVVFEGEHLLEEALRSDFHFKTILMTGEKFEKWKGRLEGFEAVVVGNDIFDGVSLNRSPEGVLAIGSMAGSVVGVPRPGSGFIYLDHVQDPVNVGILVRTAYALSYDAVLVGKGGADPFNHTALARSAGAGFHIPMVVMREDEFLGWTRMNDVQILAAEAGGAPPEEISAEGKPFVIVLGNEARGVSKAISDNCLARVAIPMRNGWDSLNVAAAGSMLMYALKNSRM